MLSKEIRDVLKENEKYSRLLERYDETREFDLDRIRRSFTIKKGTYRRLKKMSREQGKPMSRILDELVDEY